MLDDTRCVIQCITVILIWFSQSLHVQQYYILLLAHSTNLQLYFHCSFLSTAGNSTVCKSNHLGREYTGSISHTKNGIMCQAWTAQTPHTHTFTNLDWFPDTLMKDAGNYCRNPDGEPAGPWCYTKDPKIWWQHCNIPNCKGT